MRVIRQGPAKTLPDNGLPSPCRGLERRGPSHALGLGMRVLFINQKARSAGGAERYVADTAQLLTERGCEPYLLYGVPGRADPDFTGLFAGAFPMVSLTRQIRDIQPDVVYVHQLDAELDMWPIREAGVPVARFFHDHRLFCPREHKYTTLGQRTCTRTIGAGCYSCLGVITRANTPVGIRLRTVGRVRAEQAASRGIAATVVGSTYMAGHLVAHGFDPARIHVNPLFVRPTSDGAPVVRDPSLLLFVGALLRGKGLDLLLRALAVLPPSVRLRIVGDGPQPDTGLVEQLGLGARVEYCGRLTPEAVARQYREAACVVVPSRSPETFGLVGLEALSAGTPVVATDVGGVREWLVPGRTGLLAPPGDPGALAAALAWMLDHPAEAERMGREGQAHCRARFTPDRHITDLVAVFESLKPVAGRGRALVQAS